MAAGVSGEHSPEEVRQAVFDHIGSKAIAIRRTAGGITITKLANGDHVELNADEWADMVGLVLAIQGLLSTITVQASRARHVP